MTLNEIKRLIPESQDWVSADRITFGWSGEQKYQIKQKNGNDLLLRILTPEQYQSQENAINFLLECNQISKHIPKLYSYGETKSTEYYYLLLDYIKGQNGMSVIRNYTNDQQYNLGIIMGKEIKKLHKRYEAKPIPDETKNFIEKTQKCLDYFVSHKNEFNFMNNTDIEIQQFLTKINNRPLVMTHNDFHLGNMIIDNNNIFLIDFNRSCYQDRFREFDSIGWSAKYSLEFATGILDAYLENENKDEFFAFFKGYISIWQIQMLYFIQDEDEEEKKEVLDLVKFVNTWFTEDPHIPNWYREKSRIISNL